MKIGILGGTFNPIHIGHLILAEEVREKIGLDKVVFVPAYLPPHKNNADIAKAEHRYKMICGAIKGNEHFIASSTEIKREGKSYTIDTVREFKRESPTDEIFFIAGSDVLKYLADWKDLQEIIRLVKFIVATRPGYDLDSLPAYISTLSIRAVDVSAFEIRQAIQENKSFRYLVPETVYKYIVKNKLYK